MGPVFLIALACSLLQVVLGGDLRLQKRTCNHDNCLRSLLGNSAQASPFCTAYLNQGPTTTVAFTSVCTEAPNAVSTACSCLLAGTSTTTTTTTSTTTSTSSTPIATQCAASNNYGLVYSEYAYDMESAVLDFLFPYNGNVLAPGQCCNLCAQTTSCYGFTTGFSSSEDNLMYCELAVISTYGGVVGPNVSPVCPNGQYYWPQGPVGPGNPSPPSVSGSGQGPCGIF